MLNIFIGLTFIFFQTNLHVVDINPLYYATNVIGYISVFAGVKELATGNEKLLKIKPYIAFMMFHSAIFFLLNLTGYSPLTLALSTTLNTMIALFGFELIIVGKFLAFYIIYLLFNSIRYELSKIVNLKTFDFLFSTMVLSLVIACITFVFNFIPTLSSLMVGSLLISKFLFLIWIYFNLVKGQRVFLVKNEK